MEKNLAKVVSLFLFIMFFAGLYGYKQLVRPRILNWGATKEEAVMALGGDEFVSHPSYQSTRALTINAPIEKVWPWLVQIGQDRGGFYSYSWLENMAFADIHNAVRIEPKWQGVDFGHFVPLVSQNWPLGLVRRKKPAIGCLIISFQPPRLLALQGWGSFILQPEPGDKTRFIIRGRNAPMSRLSQDLMAVLFDPPHFIMEREMMLGIKRLVEGKPGTDVWMKRLATTGFALIGLAGIVVIFFRKRKWPFLAAPAAYAFLIASSTMDFRAAFTGFVSLVLVISGCLLFRRWWWAFLLYAWFLVQAVLFADGDAYVVFGLAFLGLSVLFALSWRRLRDRLERSNEKYSKRLRIRRIE